MDIGVSFNEKPLEISSMSQKIPIKKKDVPNTKLIFPTSVKVFISTYQLHP
ncbi:hypothetical protein [Oceanobacillus kapialis]|uniref:hypothetical protein n=1 Tax=Oceanobacillus kapialis TaxID=481353 RepID=UPI0038509F7E